MREGLEVLEPKPLYTMESYYIMREIVCNADVEVENLWKRITVEPSFIAVWLVQIIGQG